MDAIGVDGERQIDAVVDDERDAGAPAALAQPFGERQELSRGPGFFSQLDQARAAGDRAVENRFEIAPASRGAIEDDVERGVERFSRGAALRQRW
jgi:hypothetical protein